MGVHFHMSHWALGKLGLKSITAVLFNISAFMYNKRNFFIKWVTRPIFFLKKFFKLDYGASFIGLISHWIDPYIHSDIE